jgi:hypothetical protein
MSKGKKEGREREKNPNLIAGFEMAEIKEFLGSFPNKLHLTARFEE